MRGKTRYHRPVEPGTPLSPREVQIVGLIADGLNNAQIGARLYLAEDTIKTHVTRVLARMEAVNRAHAVALAYQRGWLRIEQSSREEAAS
jgi:DNA-binding NarL/FixJ family response regulator